MKRRYLFIRGGLAALACYSASVAAQALVGADADPHWREAEVELPAAPQESALREFFVSSASPNTFFIDERSLSVGEDGVVRYVLIVRTPGGAQNVTFEGIRCKTGQRRIYASGRADGSWSKARDATWVDISNNGYNRPRAALAAEYFCDGPVPPRDRNEALRRLRHAGGTDSPYR
ncbi:hypothetical protein B4966_04000 [Rhodocyclaceae bacterium]|nr:hypothetical protein B4966_04000 [Rhodocyclaceae bacterium]